MSEKVISTRIVHKHDIEANWIRADEIGEGFIPKQGEVIVYDSEIDQNGQPKDLTGTKRNTPYDYARFKIGDGTTVVSELPFIDTPLKNYVDTKISEISGQILQGGLVRQVVESLPEASAASDSIIYVVGPKIVDESETYEEYLFINGKFELIGGNVGEFEAKPKILDYLTYTIENNEVTILSCDVSISGNHTVPSMIDGYPLTKIANNAFQDCTSLTGITIPEGVTSIGNFAFSNCMNLTSVIIPDSVTSIGYSVFYFCISLTSITIPDSVTIIENNLFNSSGRLENVTIGKSVKIIDEWAFFDCGKLTSITLPEGVTSIEQSAFRGCGDLVEVYIPASTINISNYAFEGSALPLTIYYGGTQQQWNRVEIGSNNDRVQQATIHYNQSVKKLEEVKLNASDAVGQKTPDGGELFNDYIGNKAYGYYSYCTGANTTVGEVPLERVPLGTEGDTDVPPEDETQETFKHGASTGASAEGFHTASGGVGAKSIGIVTRAAGNGALATGVGTYAHARAANANGLETEVNGIAGTSLGAWNYANGDFSLVGGKQSITEAEASTALGVGLVAWGISQTVAGRYNSPSNQSLFIVGNGTDKNNRSNALTVERNGDINVAGKVNTTGINYAGDEIQIFSRGVCIGDSLTAGQHIRMVGNTAAAYFEKNKTYPRYLQKLMNTAITNAGVEGATSNTQVGYITRGGQIWVNNEYDRNGVNRADRTVFDATGYDFAIIQLGTNDGLESVSVDTFKTNISTICNYLNTNSPRIKIFLLGILPSYYFGAPAAYDNYNKQLEDLADENEHIYYIDMSHLSECKKNTPYTHTKVVNGVETSDGHLTALGYQKLAKEVYALISETIHNNKDEFTDLAKTPDCDSGIWVGVTAPTNPVNHTVWVEPEA